MEVSMTANGKNNKGKGAAQSYFSEVYVPEVCNIIYRQYASYSTYKTNRNRWRADIEYSIHIQETLILHAKTFIRTMSSDNSRNTNPQFLASFVNIVSDYLSGYTMRNPFYSSRKEARIALKTCLWDNFSYIQNLLTRQAQKRAAREKRNMRYIMKQSRLKER